jgi:sigma-E factor negative regulatory protein RseA
MTEVSRQTLSALLDGECSSAEMHRAIDQLLADEALRQCWERYHLIGHVIGRQPVAGAVRTVAPHVREMLAAEAVLPMTPRRKRPRLVRFAPMTAAIAAGFALVAVFVVPFDPRGEFAPSAGIADARRANEALIAGATPDDRSRKNDPLLRARLEQLVVNHHERAAGPGLSGFVSYATVVGRPGQP